MYFANTHIKICVFVISTLISTSCNFNSEKKQYPLLIVPSNKWEIFSDNIKISTLSEFLNSNNYKSIIFIDINCSACLLNLSALKHFFTNKNNIPYIIIIESSHLKTFQAFCDFKNLHFNIMHDNKSEIKEANKLHDSSFILLDCNNKIITDSNPLSNKETNELYDNINSKQHKETPS